MWKPGKVVELKEGYSIAAFRGFVSFWNWLANFVFNLKGDGALVLDDSSRGSPVLKLSGFESASDDTFPCKSGSGLTWKIPPGGSPSGGTYTQEDWDVINRHISFSVSVTSSDGSVSGSGGMSNGVLSLSLRAKYV